MQRAGIVPYLLRNIIYMVPQSFFGPLVFGFKMTYTSRYPSHTSICYKGYQTTLFLKIFRNTVYMFVCFCALLLACEWRALLF